MEKIGPDEPNEIAEAALRLMHYTDEHGEWCARLFRINKKLLSHTHMPCLSLWRKRMGYINWKAHELEQEHAETN